jgi:hypothetical protein
LLAVRIKLIEIEGVKLEIYVIKKITGKRPIIK